MIILALDPATQLGWAKLNGLRIKSGTESFHNKQWDGAGMRYLRFRKFLKDNAPYQLVVYEAVEAHTGTIAAHVYSGWVTEIQTFCEENDIPYHGYNVGKIKKFWTGNGKAKKDAMIQAARERRFNPKDDNEADALAILHLAMEEFGGLI